MTKQRLSWGGAFLVLSLIFTTIAQGGETGNDVIVNGKRLNETQLKDLRQKLAVPGSSRIPSGDYWYDSDSGLWGRRGGPTLGQILPSLNLGGPLKADASGGDTAVFINGRELHRQELAYLQRLFGTVTLGRYWLNAQGVGGHEAGPPQFRLWGTSATAGGSEGGDQGYTQRTPFGSVGGDSNCSYYLHPGGSSVLTCN